MKFDLTEIDGLNTIVEVDPDAQLLMIAQEGVDDEGHPTGEFEDLVTLSIGQTLELFAWLEDRINSLDGKFVYREPTEYVH